MLIESLQSSLIDDGGSGLHNPRHRRFAGGARGDGVADDTAALLAADAAPDVHTPVLVRGTYRVGTAVLTRQMRIRRGAVIQVPAGAVLTLPVPDAGPYPIFDTPPDAPGVRFSDAGRVRPEWFGQAEGAGVDGNAAWVALATAITRDGTTIWLRRGRTYFVGAATRMDDMEPRAICIDGVSVALDGGGTLERAPTADPALVVLWIGNARDVLVNVRLGGNMPAIPAATALDTLVLSACERVHLPAMSSADSARHGVNLDRCRYVRWGDAQVHAPRRYGISVDAGRRVCGGNMLAQGARERAGLELTNGCRDVVAGRLVSIANSDGLILGEHNGADQGSERIVYPSVFVNGVSPGAVVAAGAEPTNAQIVTQRGVLIQGGAFQGVPNDHRDVTIGTLDVFYVLQNGINASQVHWLNVGTLRLRNNHAGDRRGVYMQDCGEVVLRGGYVMGWGPMMELLRVQHVIVRDLVLRENNGALLATNCPRVTLQGLRFQGNTATDHLVKVIGTGGFAMSRLDVIDCSATGNTKSTVRVDLGSTGTLAELHWRGNMGLTLDVNRPAGYEPVGAYDTDDPAWRPAAANSASPRVDRSRSVTVQNTLPTLLTNFAGGREGMERQVWWNDSVTTTVHDPVAGLSLVGGATRLSAQGKYSGFLYQGGRWIEMWYR
jgi:hypothetical protein